LFQAFRNDSFSPDITSVRYSDVDSVGEYVTTLDRQSSGHCLARSWLPCEGPLPEIADLVVIRLDVSSSTCFVFYAFIAFNLKKKKENRNIQLKAYMYFAIKNLQMNTIES